MNPTPMTPQVPSPEKLQAALKQLEEATRIGSHDVIAELQKLIPKDGEPVISEEWRAEFIAFRFGENAVDQEDGWGLYYGPTFSGSTQDGRAFRIPDIKDVTADRIAYWEKRAAEAKNPLLRDRYLGLVWVFKKRVTGATPEHTVARDWVDASLKVAEHKLHRFEASTIAKLGNALGIAHSLNDSNLVNACKAAILKYEDVVGEDSKPGLWGFSYDLLVANDKVKLSDDEEKKIIDDLEGRLKRLKDEAGAQWACEGAAERLAGYYRKRNDATDVARVIRSLGARIVDDAAKASSPMQASAWLERLYHIYLRYDLAGDAETILKRLQSVGKGIDKQMKSITHTMKIPRKDLDEYVAAMIEGDLNSASQRITEHYVPRGDSIELQVKKIAKDAPLTAFLTKRILDKDGVVLAEVGSVEDDLEGNIVRAMAQNIQFSSIFLRDVMSAWIDKFHLTPQNLSDYIHKAPIFVKERRGLVDKGLTAYMSSDAIIAVHLLVPQIESAVRQLVEGSGGSTVIPRKQGGGFQYKQLDPLLRSGYVAKTFGDIGADMERYLRVLLTDPRGLNLRNLALHGLLPSAAMRMVEVDRVMHVLLCLAQVRPAKRESREDTEAV